MLICESCGKKLRARSVKWTHYNSTNNEKHFFCSKECKREYCYTGILKFKQNSMLTNKKEKLLLEFNPVANAEKNKKRCV